MRPRQNPFTQHYLAMTTAIFKGTIPALMKRYANLPMDLADASLVLLAGHLGHGRILTTDERDFGAYRWKSRKPFRNLMAG